MAATAEVGVTATLGAAARAVATRQGLLNDPYAEPLLGAVGIDYLTRAIADHTFAADESPVGDDPAVTSLLDALAAHTRFVDEFLAEAGRAGIRQVVILASGLDTRPYRLWWPRGTTVYEIDRPRVLDFKAGVLRGLDARLATNRCAVGIDLRDDWPAALRRVGFDAAQPTAWVAEQLLVGYLKPAEQNRLLRRLTAASAAGSRLAADHLPTWDPLQLEAERAFVEGWRRRGLDIDLASLTHPGEYHYVPEYLATHGWEPAARSIADLLGGLGLGPRRGAGSGGAQFIPEYVTATRV
ncbi:class I SAM-dependent methyltransferase [Mycobacterium avium subsp. paratuberculosis]|uniref:class I SAM-dependent methyltransferase n=1 Tax=Mycobacterium avium TaxID=1764 RepID=UPI000213AD79|nr:class I SAM-dependent methyltransferase [Mycobacterium avium]ETB08870.1 S-adenosyl-L-methionine-dependent methyltransferase [Mycobacterium avium subsp. paratuberculosis 08-8281]ETB25321.1 S-adenosyl-L-methionine-dependent methyltransferase [Mycobacterium avium subsp. hominissuis 10-4249]AZP83157.1 SAM-dependent methyltransferase [Mycobacterium avium subsp. paratuberculosis]KDO93313.1 S-adenosyl-L-methionine-dependent methyltransferase [Mycobacterium avium subsp. hominissuis A5]QPM73139.1 SA